MIFLINTIKYIIIFYFLIVVLKNKNKIEVFLFFICALPFSRTTMIFFNLNFKIANNIIIIQEVLFAILFTSIIIELIKSRKIRTNRIKSILFRNYISLYIVFLIFIIVGLINNKTDYVLMDIRSIVYYLFMIILLFGSYNKKISLNYICKGLIVYSTIIILIITFRDSLFYDLIRTTQWENTTRIGYTNILMYIYIVIYSKEIENKKLYYATCILCSISLIISQSITVIIAIFVLYFINKILFNNSSIKKGIIHKKFGVINIYIFITIFLLIAIFFSIENETFLNNNMKNILDKIRLFLNGDLASMQSRNITNGMALNQFWDNINGFGFGKTFVTYLQNGQVAQSEALFVDNLFITLLNKLGIIGTIILIININFIFIYEILKLKIFSIRFFAIIIILLMGLTTSHVIQAPIDMILIQLISYDVIENTKIKNN